MVIECANRDKKIMTGNIAGWLVKDSRHDVCELVGCINNDPSA
jgi:hypothetical protein